MLSTVLCKFENKQILFKIYEGDNLWEKIESVCSQHKLQEFQEKIFDMIYEKFQNYDEYQDDQPYKFKPHNNFYQNCYQRSISRNERCKTYQDSPLTHSPKITQYEKIQHQPFQERINLKQIVHKDHLERHDKAEIMNYSPTINTNFIHKNYIPFKDRINIKSLNQNQNTEKKVQTKQDQLEKTRSQKKQYQKSPIKDSDQEDECGLIHFSNEKTQFYQIQKPFIKNEQKSLITNIKQLNILVKCVYEQNQNHLISSESLQVCNEFYRRLITTQQDSSLLKLNQINLELLEDKEIFFLELMSKKYQLSNNLTFGKTQFLILALCLTISDEDQRQVNCYQLKELINYNPTLTAHYQQIQ